MTDFSSTLTEETKFSDYVLTILQVLNKAISQNLITPVQFTAVLLQLAELQNTQDLNAKVEELSEKYPSLKEILYTELAKTKADLDNQTQLLVSSFIKSGKSDLANEMNAELAAAKDSPVTVQEIINKYKNN